MGSLFEFICSFLLQSGSFPDHAEKMHELPDENLRDIVPIAKRIAIAQGTLDYKNILQNNGRIAHQVFTLLWIYSGIPLPKSTNILRKSPMSISI